MKIVARERLIEFGHEHRFQYDAHTIKAVRAWIAVGVYSVSIESFTTNVMKHMIGARVIDPRLDVTANGATLTGHLEFADIAIQHLLEDMFRSKILVIGLFGQGNAHGQLFTIDGLYFHDIRPPAILAMPRDRITVCP